MPWKTHSLIQARHRFVQAALRGDQSIAQLCIQFGISRKTGFKILKRFLKQGMKGLANQSRRPRRLAKATKIRWISAIKGLRQQYPSWGAKKIYARLRRRYPQAHLPRERTITDLLKRGGFIREASRRYARRGPQLPAPALTVPQAVNEVWTADFKGWFRTLNGQRVDPLTVRDLFSRYILDVRLLNFKHEAVQRHFARLFRRYGQPKIIRVDHGGPFAGDGALDLSRLSVWWLRLGIDVEFTGRGRPQDNGAHEQMHRIYKNETASPAAFTPRAQQLRTTRWIGYYNHERPHEALAQAVPATIYRKSRRRYQLPLRPLRYPHHWPKRTVTRSGYVRWRGRLRVIGRAFGLQTVAFKPVNQTTHEVYFGPHLIGLVVDSDPGGMRPAKLSKSLSPSLKP